jgi:hypothetical protein
VQRGARFNRRIKSAKRLGTADVHARALAVRFTGLSGGAALLSLGLLAG